MKISGFRCETKFGLLGFLGHPNGDLTYFAFFLGRKEPNLNHKYLVEFGELKSVFVAVCPSVLIFCGACDGFVFLSFLLNSQD